MQAAKSHMLDRAADDMPFRRWLRDWWGPIDRDESGMLTYTNAIVLMILVSFIAFMANIGAEAQNRVKLQNASDSVAYSNAVIAARSMNAVTALNHLIGEMTALCIVHESFGGPELDIYGRGIVEGKGYSVTTEHKILNEIIELMCDKSNPAGSMVNGLQSYGTEAVKQAETKPMEWVKDLICYLKVPELGSDNRKSKLYSGAALYDAQLTLKKEFLKVLIGKALANIGLWVPPPWGYITAVIAYGVHIYCWVKMVEMAVEAGHLFALEKYCGAVSVIKTSVIEGQLIPALLKLQTGIGIDDGGVLGSSGITNTSLRTLNRNLANEVADGEGVYPGYLTFRMPLRREATIRSGSIDWGSGTPFGVGVNDLSPELANRISNLNNSVDRANNNRGELREKHLTSVDRDLSDWKEKREQAETEQDAADDGNANPADDSPMDEDPEPSAEVVAAEEQLLKSASAWEEYLRSGVPSTEFASEAERAHARANPVDDLQEPWSGDLQSLQAEIRSTEGHLQRTRTLAETEDLPAETKTKLDAAAQLLEQRLQRLRDKERRKDVAAVDMSGAMQKLTQATGGQNPSHDNLSLAQFNFEDVKYSQWMRATYPYVDAMRADLRGFFEKHLTICRMSAIYESWSLKYSMCKIYQLRTNREWKERSTSSGSLFLQQVAGKRSPGDDLALPIMASDQVGTQRPPLVKGFESWAGRSSSNMNEAEQRFTFVGIATESSTGPFYGSTFFHPLNQEGTAAISQSIFYNANGLRPPSDRNRPTNVQADTGWDTLNWTSPVRAPEYPNGPPSNWSVRGTRGGSNQSPYQVLAQGPSQLYSASVTLNWQAKLVPVTMRRALRASVPGPAGVHVEGNADAGFVREQLRHTADPRFQGYLAH